jgi:Mysoin-binding motif of peroxisomes
LISFAAILSASLLLKRHWLAYLRKRVITLTTIYTTQAQAFDAASSAAMQLVQEVELVSRGYRISAPLPPASRIEERSQIKRCRRLRRALNRANTALLQHYVESYARIKDFAVQLDFERYCDVYEITRSELDEINTWSDLDQGADEESLKSMQLTLQRLYLVRKMFLCALLALSAGKASELSQWNTVSDALRSLSASSHSSASMIDDILSEENKSPTPERLKDPLSPNHERVRTQLRRFTTMSQGIRELQAKIYLLRDESDRALTTTDDITELGPRLLEQYDNFGADLRNLVHEWEEGRRALATNITKHENRLSLSPSQLISSRSTTPSSLGGLTAVGGSPADALKILNGDVLPSMNADSSDEELFEAVASPRTRSTLTREERIAKLKEQRRQQAIVREQSDAGRTMVKELESVIKLRPRTKGMRTSL